MKRKEIASQSMSSMIETFFTSLPEIAPLVMKHLGPYELCSCLQVSVQFGRITHDVFMVLASYYLACYGVGVSEGDYRYNEYKMDTECVLDALNQYRRGKMGWLTIYRFLSLWCHFYRTYRSYTHHVFRIYDRSSFSRYMNLFIYNKKEKRLASFKEWASVSTPDRDEYYKPYHIGDTPYIENATSHTLIIDHLEVVCLIRRVENRVYVGSYMYMNSVKGHCLYLTTDPVTRAK